MVRNSLLVIFLYLAMPVSAQFRDAGLWTDLSLSARCTKRLELSFAPELRFDENISNLSRIFADAGARYQFKKEFFGTVTYRFALANQTDFFETRQRVQFGVGYRIKAGDFAFVVQPRWQLALRSFSAENDADLTTTMRTKLQIKYNGFKDLGIETSIELFNNTGQYQEFRLQNWRWTAGVSKDFSKKNSVAVGYLIQKNITASPQELDFVILLSYKREMDWRKKKSDKNNSEKSAPAIVE